MTIPKQDKVVGNKIRPNNIDEPKVEKEKILFSFSSIERNEYFNIDGTCPNWSSDLFDTMKAASKISIKDVYARKYSGKHSPLRIHSHEDASPPCKVPANVKIEDMWQIRISLSKGGIHGIFVENVFYVLWFDPHHNLYPDENHGGLKKIRPASTCCKDRDAEILELKKLLEEKEKELADKQKDIDDLLLK